MTLSEKQCQFARMVAELIQWCYMREIGVTFGEAYRPKETCELYAKQGRGIANSLHEKRLAVDLNAFINGIYQAAGHPYDRMHDFWDVLGGAPRLENDLGHFSLEHEGVR